MGDKTKIAKDLVSSPIGFYPPDWEVKPLSELLEFRNGANASKEDYGSGVKFINVMDVLNNQFITADKITGSVNLSKDQIELNLVKRGDVVFNRTSETPDEVGLTSVYLDDEVAVFGGFVIRGRSINDRLNNEFKKFCFSAKAVRKQIIASGQGAIRSNIGQADLEKILIPVPPVKEQIQIANILSTCDDAIEATKNILLKKASYKRALMQNLLTGKVRFNSFTKDWEEIRLGDVAEMKSGGTPLSTNKNYYGGNIPWVVIADITKAEKYITKTEKSISEEGLKNSSARKYPIGTILFAMYASIGKCAITGVELTCNQAILGIQPNNVDVEFLYYLLSMNEEKYSNMGQAGTQSNLNKEMVSDFYFTIPVDIEEQKRIASVLSAADDEIQKLKTQLNKLKLQKKGLMQQLLTGKIRVKIKK